MFAARSTRGQRERRPSASSRGPASTSTHSASGIASAVAIAATCPLGSGTLVNVTTSRIASAIRLISVCENTVPATTGSSRLVRPSSRRESTSTREGSPIRPGRTAEAITPIIVARTTGPHGIGVSGSAARSVWCQETARISIASDISTSASAIHPGEAVTSACPTRWSSRRESANTTSAASAITASTMPTRLSTGPRDRRGTFSGAPIQAGSSRSRFRSPVLAPAAAMRHAPCRIWRLCSVCCPRSDEARSITAAFGPLMASTSPSLERQ